jgi:hypothetical protein
MSLNTVNQRGGSIITALTATGTNQATALQLANRSGLQEITTVSSSTGVVLPTPKQPGTSITIANQGVNSLAVYPQLGGSIDNGSTNASVTLSAGKSATFEASSLTNWYTVSTTATSGSGTVTSIVASTGLTGGTITSTGTIALSATGLELDSFASAITADTEATGAVTCNLATSNWHSVTLNANVTISLSNPTVGQQFTIVLVQPGSGGPYSVTSWFSTIKWAGGSAPTLTAIANKADIFTFKCYGSGTYYGMIAGQNF